VLGYRNLARPPHRCCRLIDDLDDLSFGAGRHGKEARHFLPRMSGDILGDLNTTARLPGNCILENRTAHVFNGVGFDEAFWLRCSGPRKGRSDRAGANEGCGIIDNKIMDRRIEHDDIGGVFRLKLPLDQEHLHALPDGKAIIAAKDHNRDKDQEPGNSPQIGFHTHGNQPGREQKARPEGSSEHHQVDAGHR
jgi:hypothetical protein